MPNCCSSIRYILSPKVPIELIDSPFQVSQDEESNKPLAWRAVVL